MINFQRVFRNIFNSINWIDLLLLTLNSGIGLAITNYLGYEIDWVISVNYILWTALFYFGTEMIWFNSNLRYQQKDKTFRRLMISVSQLLTILFLSLSVIPLIQILIATFKDPLVVYLISLTSFWLLLKVYFERSIGVFGLSETISAFIICFINPLVILNINGIQIHEILLPVSFFSFLQIIANKIFRDISTLENEFKKAEFVSSYIGPYSKFRITSGLIIFGYLACISLLFLQDRMPLIFPLWFSLPFALLIVIKLIRTHGDKLIEAIALKPLVNLFALFVETAWIIGLWVR